MGDLQQQALALATEQLAPGWLGELRRRGGTRFSETPWPTRRTEQWKYTPLNQLGNKQIVPAGESEARVPEAELIGVDGYRLVFVNGQFRAALSDALPDGITTFAEADEAQVALMHRHLGRLADSRQHLFAALGEATLDQGLLIHVAAGQRLDKPVYIIHYSAGSDAVLASSRLMVVLDTGAEAEIIEQFISESPQQSNLVVAHSELVLGDNARCKHYRLNLELEGISHMGGVFVELSRDSLFDGFALAKGGEIIRNDYVMTHRGSGAHVELNGVYLPRGRQLVDYHTNIQHCVPHCTSNEVFRGIVGDRAKAVFNGRIHIHEHAQKTLAQLSNKNLLTSNRAEVDTKPELEIYADDVKCAHGATVAKLDDESLYYLRTRGIDREQAQVMVSFGFINELIQTIDNCAVVDYLLPKLAEQFGHNPDFLLMEADALESL